MTASATAAFCASVNGEPFRVLKTTVPVAPAVPGMEAARCSVTTAVGVPGIEISLEGVLPKAAKAATATARIAIQVARTARRRDAAIRPIR